MLEHFRRRFLAHYSRPSGSPCFTNPPGVHLDRQVLGNTTAWLRESSAGSWQQAVQKLGLSPFRYRRPADNTAWTGDLFSRNNPLWLDRGVVAPGKNGLRVINSRPGCQAAFEILQEVASGRDFAPPLAPAAPTIAHEPNRQLVGVQPA